jgi:GTP-binding protein
VADEQKLANAMRIRSAVFDTSAPDITGCPPPGLPEFPFIGRSNVGKSSLLNLLTGRKGLAKVSARPGHTQLINFFTINDQWRLVDLPGYGYARVSKEAQEKFADIITGFLLKRPVIVRVFVLIDSRHEPHRIDLEFVSWLAGCGVPYVLVFTKVDKLKPAAVQRNITAFGKALEAEWNLALPEVFTCSSLTGAGRAELLAFLGSLL